MLSYHTRNLWAVQRNAKSIYLEHSSGRNCTVQADFAITNLTLNQINLILSNGRCLSSYKIEKVDEDIDIADSSKKIDKVSVLTVQLIQTFVAECLAVYIYNQNIFCLTSNDVMVYSIGGVILNKVQTNDVEGKLKLR